MCINAMQISKYFEKHKDVIKYYYETLKYLDYDSKIIKFSDMLVDYQLVDLPISLYTGKILIYSGPAAVFRSLVQFYYKPGDKIPVFGNAQSCLKACKERSKWTLMCEQTIVDLISTFIYDIKCFKEDIFSDLCTSFKIHKDLVDTKDVALSKKHLHPFLEGPRKTLSDVIIAFYFLEFSMKNKAFLDIISKYDVILDWLNLMKTDRLENIINSLEFLPISWKVKESRLQTNDDHTFSLTDGLAKMSVSAKNITELRDVISDENLSTLKRDFSTMPDSDFDWDLIPAPLRPTKSQIPEGRQSKKSYQLINMVECANRLVKPGMTIVDFCSGGGHLGLLMAALHEDCHVILLENKEESLIMAQDRIKESGLKNIKLYKCNIYAYKGHFDIGLALHACGSVTDLVIEICLTRSANMVISPCCYGSIAPNPIVSYPRSAKFSQVQVDMYSKLCHAADCFNAKQARTDLGHDAMNLVDSDRSYYVAERNYSTEIYKMIPADCTPKNHILYCTKLL